MIGAQYLKQLQARLQAALHEAALLVAEKARELAPHASGALVESIIAEENRVAATAPYALAVELNTPYLRPALLESRAGIVALLKAGVTS